MKIFVVRMIHNKEAVGIFACNDIERLFWLVDGCGNPYACEYTDAPQGGVYWPKPDMPPIMHRVSATFQEPPEPPACTLTEDWAGLFLPETSRKRPAIWRRLS